ncbi:hypothetical protein EON65_29610 [archaeon]|nr:MAG: hypothetical protein EON65_29610 [archaeon]
MVSYTTRAGTAVFGLLFYFYPVFNQSAVTTVTTTFTSNVATTGSGGVMYVFSNNLYVSVINGMFQYNSTLGGSRSGGAAYFWDSNSGLVLSGCQMIGNKSQQYGGGLSLVSAHGGVQISSCQFVRNTAGSAGGSVSMETSIV